MKLYLKIIFQFLKVCIRWKTYFQKFDCKALGEFISLIDKKDNENFVELFDFYVDTIQKIIMKGKRDEKAIIQKCLFNFPAILFFLEVGQGQN